LIPCQEKAQGQDFELEKVIYLSIPNQKKALKVKGDFGMDERQKNLIYDSIAASILNARFEDIDQATVENTRTRILDTTGCAIGGAALPDIVSLVKMVAHWGGQEEASILGYGIKAPVHNVAFVNCTMCRGFDRGPLAYLFNGRIVPHHVSETTVLTALALGENTCISGKELIWW
jgi:hypothetical protein